MKRLAILVLLCAISLSACDLLPGSVSANPPAQVTIIPPVLPQPQLTVVSATPQMMTLLPTETFTPTATLFPTETPTPTETETPIPSDTPTPEATATWEFHDATKVIAPILLYHHIGTDGENNNRYFVAPDVFEKQLQELRSLGYTGITISTLVDVIVHGGDLPQRPVVITFDDGNEDVFTTAFPLMQQYGYPGTFFIVANRVGAVGFVSANQLKELAAAGWEIGSHSMSHIDLTADHDVIWQEAANSRIRLEQELEVPVRSFAYPFGKTDPTVTQKVQDYGYTSAVGLGTYTEHGWGSLYYLSREEVRASYDMDAFEVLLPWK